jgi:hypothetical protein
LSVSDLTIAKHVQDASDLSSAGSEKLVGTWSSKLAGYGGLISNGVEFKPTGDVQFKKNESLYFYFDIFCQGLVDAQTKSVDMQVRVVELKTGKVVSDPGFISAMPYAKVNDPVIPVGRGIQIHDLPSGQYRLDVRALDSAGRETNWASAAFAVE